MRKACCCWLNEGSSGGCDIVWLKWLLWFICGGINNWDCWKFCMFMELFWCSILWLLLFALYGKDNGGGGWNMVKLLWLLLLFCGKWNDWWLLAGRPACFAASVFKLSDINGADEGNKLFWGGYLNIPLPPFTPVDGVYLLLLLLLLLLNRCGLFCWKLWFLFWIGLLFRLFL